MNDVDHTDQTNPLMPFVRQPTIFVQLPSNGNFVDPNDYETSIDGELGVCAMTTSDELLLKTPDALLNGESIAKIIQSCVPGIKNVYNLPNPDIDILLLAIRKASYGDEMDFSVSCPKCKTENTYSTSLDTCLTQMTFLEEVYTEKLSNDVIVSLKPYTYKSNMKHSLMTFNEGQIMKALLEENPNKEELHKIYQENLVKIATLLVELTADCILEIWDPDGNKLSVTYNQIVEWIREIPRKDAEKLQIKITEMNNVGIDKKTQVKCPNKECGHEWETEIVFDPAHFFG